MLNEGMDANVAAWGTKLNGVTPLHLAAEGGHLKVMDVLLERGANIDARTKGPCRCKYSLQPCLYPLVSLFTKVSFPWELFLFVLY